MIPHFELLTIASAAFGMALSFLIIARDLRQQKGHITKGIGLRSVILSLLAVEVYVAVGTLLLGKWHPAYEGPFYALFGLVVSCAVISVTGLFLWKGYWKRWLLDLSRRYFPFRLAETKPSAAEPHRPSDR